MSVIPCTSTPIVTGIVVFDPVAFVALYPEFTGIDPSVLQANFALATLQLCNTCGSAVKDGNAREMLLDLLTAHITLLANGTVDAFGNVTTAPGLVGRLSSATEGSVTAAAEAAGIVSLNQEYFYQTKYGAQYYQATARYRTALYLAPARGCSPFGLPFGLPFGPC
jgi:hypothetical protein